MSWCCLAWHCLVEFLRCKRSAPLARTVYRFLERVQDFCAVPRAVQRHGNVPHSVFPAALAEPQVAFHVDVIDGSRRALPITRCHTHLRGQIMRKKKIFRYVQYWWLFDSSKESVRALLPFHAPSFYMFKRLWNCYIRIWFIHASKGCYVAILNPAILP